MIIYFVRFLVLSARSVSSLSSKSGRVRFSFFSGAAAFRAGILGDRGRERCGHALRAPGEYCVRAESRFLSVCSSLGSERSCCLAESFCRWTVSVFLFLPLSFFSFSLNFIPPRRPSVPFWPVVVVLFYLLGTGGLLRRIMSAAFSVARTRKNGHNGAVPAARLHEKAPARVLTVTRSGTK